MRIRFHFLAVTLLRPDVKWLFEVGKVVGNWFVRLWIAGMMVLWVIPKEKHQPIRVKNLEAGV